MRVLNPGTKSVIKLISIGCLLIFLLTVIKGCRNEESGETAFKQTIEDYANPGHLLIPDHIFRTVGFQAMRTWGLIELSQENLIYRYVQFELNNLLGPIKIKQQSYWRCGTNGKQNCPTNVNDEIK